MDPTEAPPVRGGLLPQTPQIRSEATHFPSHHTHAFLNAVVKRGRRSHRGTMVTPVPLRCKDGGFSGSSGFVGRNPSAQVSPIPRFRRVATYRAAVDPGVRTYLRSPPAARRAPASLPGRRPDRRLPHRADQITD